MSVFHKPPNDYITKCRICGGDLIKVLGLGHHPPSDAFLTEEQLHKPEVYYPLNLMYCSECTLGQLDYTVPPSTLFQNDYPYVTGINGGGKKHFYDFAKDVIKKFKVTPKDLVVDIGGNDGTLLEGFQKHIECEVVNVDPSGVESSVQTEKKFWDLPTASYIARKYGKAKVITATNVFAHVNNPHGFLDGVRELLADDGVFVIEAPYIGDMIKYCQFDQIYHEHLMYLSPFAVDKAVSMDRKVWMHEDEHRAGKFVFSDAKSGLRLEYATHNDFHGGSYRYFITKGDKIANFSEVNYLPGLIELVKRISQLRQDLINLIFTIKLDNKRIVGVSAPAKGNTLLNFFGIGLDDLDYLSEICPIKIGKFSPGQHIPVVSEEKLIEDQPEYALMLACNFKKNIVKAVRRKGYKGKFIIPYPKLEIV